MLVLPDAIRYVFACCPVKVTVTTGPAITEANVVLACKPVSAEPVVTDKMLENGAPENGANPNMSTFQKGAKAPVN